MRKILALFLGIIFTMSVFGNNRIKAAPIVHAYAFLLMEASSGRIIAERNAFERIFPAATTMVLTAILAYEHIGADEIIIAGNEVNMLPTGSGRVGHEVGEAITGQNLIRAMLIGPGNDSALIVAMEIARRHTGDPNISFGAGIATFSSLMNNRASQIGALDTNFVNPHGYHHDNHFSTAHDIVQIARYAMQIDAIREIVGQMSFSGPMAGPNPPAGISNITRTWNSPNELIRPGDNFFPYAAGIRTGFTNQAGESLASFARREGIDLVAATFNSPRIGEEPSRWQDNINLFEYGFQDFAFRNIQMPDQILGEVEIFDPILGDDGILEFFAIEHLSYFMSEAELERVVADIHFHPEFVENDGSNPFEAISLNAPIAEGETIGQIRYMLDGEVIHTAELIAMREVVLRTRATDIDYYMEWVRNNILSASAIPFWVSGFSVLILFTVLYILARNAMRKKKSKYKVKT